MRCRSKVDANNVVRTSLFRDGAYLRVWLVGGLTGIVRWLELLAFGLYAIDATGSPVFVGLLALLRFLPLALFGIFIGALGDMLDAKRLMCIALGLIIAVNAGLFALFVWGQPAYWHIAVAAFLSGVFWACDLPLRRRMIGDLVASDRVAEAMSLDNVTSNGTRMIGPLLGGLIYQSISISGVFLLGAVLYLISLWLTFGTAYASTSEHVTGSRLLRPLRGAMTALQHAWGDGDLLRIMGVTVIFNIWGFPFLAMIPVIGREDLALSDGWIGAVTSLEGAFAVVGALVIARSVRPERYRAFYFFGCFAHLGAVFFIGMVPGVTGMAVGMIAAGLFIACFASMQGTLVYTTSPVEMRGRFLGLLTISIGTGLIGFSNVGITAELFGASNALWIIAIEGTIPLAILGWTWKELRNGRAAIHDRAGSAG